jgi:hypothetical protein
MADSRSPLLIPAFAPIAGGWFTLGAQLGQEDERPPHPVFVDSFELGVVRSRARSTMALWRPPVLPCLRHELGLGAVDHPFDRKDP